jgi:hypothetical protein
MSPTEIIIFHLFPTLGRSEHFLSGVSLLATMQVSYELRGRSVSSHLTSSLSSLSSSSSPPVRALLTGGSLLAPMQVSCELRGRSVSCHFASCAVATASLVDTGGGAEVLFPFDLNYDLVGRYNHFL